MFDIIYRYDPAQRVLRQPPADADEARRRLEEGNREFASLGGPPGAVPTEPRVVFFDLEDIGIAPAGGAPRQRPFAVVVGCSDARVPLELIFNRACNEMFVVRVAGPVLGQEGLGSIDYAVEHLGAGLRLLVVLGHSHCGAVTAAVDAFLSPVEYLALASSHALRAVINALLPAVRGAAVALSWAWGEGVEKQPGYRAALIEAAIPLNAALTAAVLQKQFAPATGNLRVVFGMYDLLTRQVGVPLEDPAALDREVHLLEPPRDQEGFIRLGAQMARSDRVRRVLGAGR
ncbi:MAG TPA: carbonic anhydrase [Gemmataceae bacterium]|nr:carbonic anhydrase [Gemmataceae bacterium]